MVKYHNVDTRYLNVDMIIHSRYCDFLIVVIGFKSFYRGSFQ